MTRRFPRSRRPRSTAGTAGTTPGPSACWIRSARATSRPEPTGQTTSTTTGVGGWCPSTGRYGSRPGPLRDGRRTPPDPGFTIPIYGWTWVDTAPWGWAPYHHGRWVHVNGYWGWAPGPAVVRPVYAPGLCGLLRRPARQCQHRHRGAGLRLGGAGLGRADRPLVGSSRPRPPSILGRMGRAARGEQGRGQPHDRGQRQPDQRLPECRGSQRGRGRARRPVRARAGPLGAGPAGECARVQPAARGARGQSGRGCAGPERPPRRAPAGAQPQPIGRGHACAAKAQPFNRIGRTRQPGGRPAGRDAPGPGAGQEPGRRSVTACVRAGRA